MNKSPQHYEPQQVGRLGGDFVREIWWISKRADLVGEYFGGRLGERNFGGRLGGLVSSRLGGRLGGKKYWWPTWWISKRQDEMKFQSLASALFNYQPLYAPDHHLKSSLA